MTNYESTVKLTEKIKTPEHASMHCTVQCPNVNGTSLEQSIKCLNFLH